VVFDMAKDYGLVLLEDGSLVDTAAGEAVPTDVPPMAPTSRAAADALNKMDTAQAQAIVWRHANSDGTSATPIIGEEGPLNWDHGFNLDRIDIAPGETVDWDDADGKDVLFIHRGSVDVECEDGFVTLGEGDTISLPVGLPRRLLADAGATAYLVYR
jgi:quercetin dioxygenase-like cupin family protein